MAGFNVPIRMPPERLAQIAAAGFTAAAQWR